jgi:hypothetical protein
VEEGGSRRGAGFSILYVAISGNLVIALGPIYWGGFSAYARFSDALIGKIMSAEYFGATVATVAGILYMHRAGTKLRRVAYWALAVYVVGNYLTPSLLGDPQLLRAGRFFCGLSSGTSFLAAATAVTGLKNASRLIPIFYGSPFIAGFFLQPILPRLFSSWGFDTSFRLVALAAAASVLVYPIFPRQTLQAPVPAVVGAPRSNSWLGLGLVTFALLLQYVANSGVWLFFERIGVVSGHTEQTAAAFVGLGTGMALLGTVLSTVLARNLTPLYGILLGTCMIGISTFMLHFSGSLTIYAGSVSLFNVMITFVTSFYFILLNDLFHSARAVVLGNIALMLGFSLGPLLIGYTVEGNNFAVSINATIGLFALSLALILVFAVLWRGRLQWR